MNPVVSVVMPTYNSEKYVTEAMKSILWQTFTNFEFLVINEYGSEDKTVQIVESYADPRIRVIRNTRRLGIAESLNSGIRQSRGKYIARMDSDDIAVAQRFEKQVRFLEANPGIAVYGGWQQYFGRSNVIHKTPESHDEIKVALLFKCDICHSTVMFRREEMLEHNLLYAPSFKAEDYELWTRAAQKVKFANSQEILGYYRATDDNTTVRNKSSIIEQEQYIYENLLKLLGIDYKKNYPPYLLRGWCSSLYEVPQAQWRERIAMIKKLFVEIWEKNKIYNIYNGKHLSFYLNRQYLRSLDIYDSPLEKNTALPFEYIMDDILDELSPQIEGKQLCVFGLGKIGSRALPYFKRRFGRRLVSVSDNDPTKWGKIYYGLECIPPDALDRELPIVITTKHEGIVEISEKLVKKGFNNVLPYVPQFQHCEEIEQL